MKYDALYVRQSIEKKDSISVESQLEYCRYEAHGKPCLEYCDRGFSGKDTHRPDFERMMLDIKGGIIKRVIVYKLDRISRSILDFANMMEVFFGYEVEFISSTEKFDTSTPIGRAMLNLCIVFAQLERETIQKRVLDAYYARNKRGFYMGGRVPYGFRLKKIVIDNVSTSMYEEVKEESEQLKIIYSLYADSNNSLGDIIAYLNQRGIKNLRNGTFSTGRISEMLRNPIYVKADIDIYRFFKNQGADIYNPASDFIGKNGCYLYKGVKSTTRKQSDLTNKEIILAPHNGFISSKVWLACRNRCLKNRQSAKTCKAKNSWLCGKVKCGNCGYGLVIRKSKTKWERYFVCSSVGNTKTCKGTGGTIYALVLENYIEGVIKGKLKEFKELRNGEEILEHPKINEIKMKLIHIEDEIADFLTKVGSANEILMDYINEKIICLHREKNLLKEEMMLITHQNISKKSGGITNHGELWDSLSFEDKQEIIDIFIKVIRIGNGIIEIEWNM